MITKYYNLKALQYVAKMKFSGGHHHEKVYDWRDDTSVNTTFEQDHRQIGVTDPMDYTFPHTAHAHKWHYSAPDNYNAKDLTVNMQHFAHKGELFNLISCPQTDWAADIAHEKDYESEDLDFQPQSFETQHFRKKGPIWMWLLAGTLPLTFFGNELFYQGWSDEDAYRYQRPPPLNYPDEDDTPDLEDFLVFQTPQYNNWYDAGIAKKPYMTIQDGKKIFFPHAGVNQPAQIPELV